MKNKIVHVLFFPPRLFTVALFNENDESVNQLAYNVSAKITNIVDKVLPDNKILQRSEYVVNDMYNVTRVGKETSVYGINCLKCFDTGPNPKTRTRK